MKVIKMQQLEAQPDILDEITGLLESGALVCLPCHGSYRILADLENPDAVSRLQQSKHRTHKAPSLVFVPNEEMLHVVAERVSPMAQVLGRQLWPGPLTILFEANPDLLPRRTLRELTKANGKIGVRIPDDPLCARVLELFGRPLLVSSANRQRRHGETSPAQIRRTFLGRIALFVDDGDLAPQPSSTVVDLDEDAFTIMRAGAIDSEAIEAALGV